MSERRYAFVEGEYYHVYNRGNSKQTIFFDAYDYLRFMRLLYVSNSALSFKLYFLQDPVSDFDRGAPLVSIGAYCLMPNHFHILLTPAQEGGLSKFMQKLATGYSMYFNSKYERSGSLFEGKFKSQHADGDEYLKYLFAYIHLNPLKLLQSDWKEVGVHDREKALAYVEKYRYSSLPEYLGTMRKEGSILDRHLFPRYFEREHDVRKNLFDWLVQNPHKQARPV